MLRRATLRSLPLHIMQRENGFILPARSSAFTTSPSWRSGRVLRTKYACVSTFRVRHADRFDDVFDRGIAANAAPEGALSKRSRQEVVQLLVEAKLAARAGLPGNPSEVR